MMGDDVALELKDLRNKRSRDESWEYMANQPVPRHHVTKLLLNISISNSADGTTIRRNDMAGLVFDSPVTLVVKTPNQKVDDLRIDCALEWSVEQLKRHLSSVYPTKPVKS